jgi:transposase InsO family protein
VSFVQQHKQAFGVEPLLAVLGEPVSTFYDRAGHRPSARALSDAALLERIEAIWEASRQTYGSPRVHAMLLRQGHAVGENRVAHLMAKAGIEGAHLRKHWKTTRQDARNTAAPDLVDRKFTAAAPNRLWVADFSYILTMQGVLYLATVLDVFSRKIVGWQMSARMTTDLVLSAFEMALWRRDVVRQQLVHHSDKGSQYTALSFTQRLVDAGVDPSTGSVGDSYDNAMAESLFSTIKRELIYRQRWASRHDAELAIFSYIDGFYNPERIQDALGMLSPDEFEALHLSGQRPAGAPGKADAAAAGTTPQARSGLAGQAVPR